jgi:predicted permease
LRWSWGYNVLLAPPDKVEHEAEHTSSGIEQGQEDIMTILRTKQKKESKRRRKGIIGVRQLPVGVFLMLNQTLIQVAHACNTPAIFVFGSLEASSTGQTKPNPAHALLATPTNGNAIPGNGSNSHIMSVPSIRSSNFPTEEEIPDGPRGWPIRIRSRLKQDISQMSDQMHRTLGRSFQSLPGPVQKGLSKFHAAVTRFLHGLWAFMNPPLWAMLAAIIVASVPSLQRVFFSEGTFISNSVTRAISQSGGVAIPLILVVLGANLAKHPSKGAGSPSGRGERRKKLLIASLISRMLLPPSLWGRCWR